MIIHRYVLKDEMVGFYVDAHSTAKNTIWCTELIDAKIFFRLRHALRWHKRLDTDDGMINIVQVKMVMRNSIRDVLKITEVGIVGRPTWQSDVDKVLGGEPLEEIPEPILKISGLWEFIPRGAENKYENKRGYKKPNISDSGEIR